MSRTAGHQVDESLPSNCSVTVGYFVNLSCLVGGENISDILGFGVASTSLIFRVGRDWRLLFIKVHNLGKLCGRERGREKYGRLVLVVNFQSVPEFKTPLCILSGGPFFKF